MSLLEVEGINMAEESQSEYKLDGPPVTEDELSKRIGERIQEIVKERQRLAHSGLLKDTQGPSVSADEGLKQLLEIQDKIHPNKGAITREDVRKQISHRTEEFLRTGRKVASLDSEPGLRELYGLLKNPDNRVPTYEEKVAREMAQKEEKNAARLATEPQPRKSLLSKIRERFSGFIKREEREPMEDKERATTDEARKLRKDSGFLRSNAGFLRGVGVAVFSGGKEGLRTGVETFLKKMGESKLSQGKASGVLPLRPGSI